MLDAESPVQEKRNALDVGRVRGDVRFEDVSFGYSELSPVLKGVDSKLRGRRLSPFSARPAAARPPSST